jgi:hypothetical protein
MPDIIAATFCDIRTVKGRKMLQIICEVPLEEAEAAMSLLGFPKPADPVWVGIARLKLPAGADRPSNPADNLGSDSSPAIKPAPATKRERTPAERAAFLCTLPEFRRWYGAPTEEAAAHQMRQECGVTSRAQITTNPDAHEAFKRIEDAFHRRNEPPVLSEAERYA